ncbi:Pimeloyl-ACP methyl ester carboxylesterase [Fictibacillus enclensis]|uniref:Acetyltransferase n=1 Tax=Fictibacillus enclensis TaxID=1017270 RepID=A0A0V8JBP0_9BACL|nr:alpha/beta hydrolase [Fictibacillus enclensis]KSU84393.1 acetyltransferase [Fictibacillus enclensis]SCB78595.1 Pimeloyl-ACP methyl ester carboxylesterase [Fictibacillus enclensis]
MKEKIISINGMDICTENFGEPEDPPILLIMGAMSSLDWWDEDFCSALAAEGRYVIRYDHRDLGKSVVYEPGTSNYTITDLADDAIHVLDAYALEKAHVVGMSMGGMVCQILAVRNPQRVQSLTLIASSVFGTEQEKLPPMDQKILDHHGKGSSLDWSDRDAVISYLAGGWRTLAGSKPFEKERMYRLAGREMNRARQLQSRFNHALLGGGEEFYDRMGEIAVPAVVIHGTEDPALPFEHGKALARAIPHSQLISLEGSGHELHRTDWDTIIASIVKTSSLIENNR